MFLLSCHSQKNKTGNGNESNNSKHTAALVQPAVEPAPDLTALSSRFGEQSTQHFVVGAGHRQVITSKGGLKVTVDRGVLEKEDGSDISGTIYVEIIELTSSFDFFKCNAATVSNDRLLSSGGSYYLGMENGGQKLRIKEGRRLKIELPRQTEDAMELFYGRRDEEGNMNWEQAGQRLTPAPAPDFELSENGNRPDAYPVAAQFEPYQYRPFKSLDENVYYGNRMMTLRQMVDSINRYTRKVFIDTIYAWPPKLRKMAAGTRLDTNHLIKLYGPMYQYFLKTFRREEEEKARAARAKAMQDSLVRNWQPQSLVSQLQKYYAPSFISTLGWINCDCFYDAPQWTNVNIVLPDSIQPASLRCFMLFKSMRGMMNLGVAGSGKQAAILQRLPAGQEVILIAFVKLNGRIQQCREEFVINKNKAIQLRFTEISAGDMSRMFGKNVRI